MTGPWSRWKSVVSSWGVHHKTLPKPWALFRRSLADYRKHWKVIAGLVLVVSVPVALVSNYLADPKGDTTISAYLAFAQLAMNAALIYAIVGLLHGHRPSIRESYYKGSAMLVRMVLVSALLLLMGLFIVLGFYVLIVGAFAPDLSLVVMERFLLAVFAILLTIPGIVLLVRGSWAMYAIFEGDEGPIQAVRTSRRLTKGRVVITLGRLLALLGLMLILMIAPIVLLITLQNLTHWAFWLVLLQISSALIVLPLSNIYLYRYYQGLK